MSTAPARYASEEESKMLVAQSPGPTNGEPSPLASQAPRVHRRSQLRSTPSHDGLFDPTALPLLYSALRLAPVVALYSLATGMVEPAFMELLKNKVCHVEMQYSPEACADLTANETVAMEVQTKMAEIKMLESLIEAVSCVFFSIFLGSWTDEFGRRTFMLVPFIGYTLGYAYMTAYAYGNISPYFMLITPVIFYTTGAVLWFNTAVYSFLGDYTTDANRAINIAIIVSIRTVFRDLGGVLSGHMLETYGEPAPFYMITTVFLCGFLYVWFFIHDLAPFKSIRGCRCGSVFTCKRANDGWIAVSRPRAGRGRLLLWLMILCLFLIAICISSDISVSQFYFEYGPLFWTLLEFTVFYLVVGLVESVVTVVVVLLLKLKFNTPDAVIGVLSILSAMASLFIYGFANTPQTVYIASAVGVFRMLSFVAVTSIIIGIAGRSEIGKVVTIMISQIGTAPFFMHVIFSNIFAHSKEFWPGLAWVVAALMLIPVLVGFFYAYVLQRRHSQKTQPTADSR